MGRNWKDRFIGRRAGPDASWLGLLGRKGVVCPRTPMPGMLAGDVERGCFTQFGRMNGGFWGIVLDDTAAHGDGNKFRFRHGIGFPVRH